MEGMRQLDEFNRIREDLPDLAARVVINGPLIPPLRDLKPEELDVLQLAHNYGVFEDRPEQELRDRSGNRRDRPQAAQGILPAHRMIV